MPKFNYKYSQRIKKYDNKYELLKIWICPMTTEIFFYKNTKVRKCKCTLKYK